MRKVQEFWERTTPRIGSFFGERTNLRMEAALQFLDS